jgi:hypothetical protein
MSGRTIQIFSIMVTAMGILNPIKAMAGTNASFARFDNGKTELLMPKLAWCGVHTAALGIAAWKMASMGLLPLTSADWTGLLGPREWLEEASVAMPIG